MVKRLPWAYLVALALVAAGPPAASAELGPDDLELVETKRLAPRLLELTFRTPALADESAVRVLLPRSYRSTPSRRYPVLYLLHGCCQGRTGYSSWTAHGDLQRLTARRPMIVVMPDSGPEGGYVDWYNHGAGGPPMWETYHVRQLLPSIDRRFRTIARRRGRAVAGSSMGGFGAMHYAARHPDRFIAAASFSGAVDSNSVLLSAFSGFDGVQSGKAPSSPNGLRASEEVRWRGHNPYDLAENLDGIDLTLTSANGEPGGPDGGPGDPVEWEVHKESVGLHRRLVELGIPHVWNDHGPGCHGCYLQEDLERLIPSLVRVFADPPRPRPRIAYRSIDGRYEAYGWRVAIDRPALEFSELREAGRDGFSLRGSGAATVTTPRRYEPGRKVVVGLIRGAGTESKRLRVGRDCRLRLRIPLGPGNRDQQLSPAARLHGIGRALQTPGTITSADTSGSRLYETRARIDATGVPRCPHRDGGRHR